MLRVCASVLLLIAATAAAPALAQPAGDPGQALPEDFKGKVIYFGNHSGEVVSMRTLRAGPKRDCPRPDQRCPERIGGALEVELEFDGDIVRGKYRGTGGLRESDLIGRRVGSQCRLYDVTDGSVWSGRCDDQTFFGGVKSVPNAGVQISLSFEVVGTRMRDYSERRRRRLEAIARIRRYRALRAQYEGGGSLETRFTAGIELDATTWMVDRLRPGSIRDVTRTKPRKGLSEVYASFQLEGGGQGWARGRVQDETITCAEFWDIPGYCRPLNIPQPPPEPEPEPTPASDEYGDAPAAQSSSMLKPVAGDPVAVAFRLGDEPVVMQP